MFKKRKGALNLETGKELVNICKANVNEKVFIVNESVLNVLSNFIPHETKLCDDKDPRYLTFGLTLFYEPEIKFSNKTNIP